MDVGHIETTLLLPRKSKNAQRRWPFTFWLMLKLLSVFSQRRVVTKRRCFSCKVQGINQKQNSLHTKGKESEFEIDCFLLAYENDSEEANSQESVNLSSYEREVVCEVCNISWWNFYRKVDRYNEKEIGVGWWNHPGSNILSWFILLTTTTLLVFDVVYLLPKMWARPDQTLHLLNKMTLFLLMLSYPIISMCSKLRSLFKQEVPSLAWASVMNARYIIKRAQYLNLPQRGLPNRFFLIACLGWPLVNSIYRAYIFIFVSECPLDIHIVTASGIGILLMPTWGCFAYIIYLIRVSFQHHFALLLSFFKEHEGKIDKCRGAMAGSALDFSCFRQLCDLYVVIMFPVAVIAVTSNVTWEYMLFGTCIMRLERSWGIQMHIKRLAWSEMCMCYFLYITAQGGLQVGYLWDNLFFNILQLKSDRHRKFWNTLSKDMSLLFQGNNVLLTTILCSVIGLFMAFKFGDQDVAFLANACNATNVTDTSCF